MVTVLDIGSICSSPTLHKDNPVYYLPCNTVFSLSLSQNGLLSTVDSLQKMDFFVRNGHISHHPTVHEDNEIHCFA